MPVVRRSFGADCQCPRCLLQIVILTCDTEKIKIDKRPELKIFDIDSGFFKIKGGGMFSVLVLSVKQFFKNYQTC